MVTLTNKQVCALTSTDYGSSLVRLSQFKSKEDKPWHVKQCFVIGIIVQSAVPWRTEREREKKKEEKKWRETATMTFQRSEFKCTCSCELMNIRQTDLISDAHRNGCWWHIEVPENSRHALFTCRKMTQRYYPKTKACITQRPFWAYDCSVRFSSVRRPIGRWGGGDLRGDSSEIFFQSFLAEGLFEQFWHGQGCPLFDVAQLAFPLPTTAYGCKQYFISVTVIQPWGRILKF